MTILRMLPGLALAALLALPALAQPSTPPQKVRGEIAKVEGDSITVKTRSGNMQEIMLMEKTGIKGVIKAKFSEVVAEKFVGIASQPQPDGSLKAIEVVVFPEAMRGTAEGHFAWDLTSGSMMTNANVAAAVKSMDGRELTLAPKDHASVKIMVPQDVPIVTFIDSDKSKLVPGAKVFVVAAKQSDGSLSALFVAVGVNIAPPM